MTFVFRHRGTALVIAALLDVVAYTAAFIFFATLIMGD